LTVLTAGSVAVVTGGAGGIGLAVCEALAEGGVAIACLEHPAADRVAFHEVCQRHGVPHLMVPVDVTDQVAVAVAVSKARSLGTIRYAVNCAGIHDAAPSEMMSAAQWRHLIDVDLSGVFYSCQAEYGAMTEAGGAIVNIASMSGSIINRGGDPSSSYMAAKAGVAHLSRSLGVEWATRSIRVNSLSPGYTRTAMTAKNPAELNAAFCVDIPMQRMAEPSEIAAPVLFLLSDAASYITAFDLRVDGGYTAW
jgi:NAD(P)-dependent dehydrogenase (short-subunit alcohol dehydrogenase family)